ncbi:hypothetical protein GDO81_008112 [Engystomops pustulosus]|uniref:Secreted protein n=1 Tax=Engystomops pustulosus TaxID=76066 RepID=A0AAV7CC58_ENGPU|nr:hypothetical protein GDO81_008112 [Engystomops pustulosus]
MSVLTWGGGGIFVSCLVNMSKGCCCPSSSAGGSYIECGVVAERQCITTEAAECLGRNTHSLGECGGKVCWGWDINVSCIYVLGC